jgi:hypothetical protein
LKQFEPYIIIRFISGCTGSAVRKTSGSGSGSNDAYTGTHLIIGRVVNLWLYLVGDELRLDELRGSGYDMYVKDATRLVPILRMNEVFLPFLMVSSGFSVNNKTYYYYERGKHIGFRISEH